MSKKIGWIYRVTGKTMQWTIFFPTDFFQVIF